MQLSTCGATALVLALFSVGCSGPPDAMDAKSTCAVVSVSSFADNPRPWIGKKICTSGTLYQKNDFHAYLNVRAPSSGELPAGVVVFLESFEAESAERKMLNTHQGAEIRIAAKLSIFEDCWEAEEYGDTSDPCLPARKPIFLDEIVVLPLIE